MFFEVGLENLEIFAGEFWSYVKGFKVFAFFGEMGAGKTTIIEALCKARGVHEIMGSPTFSIINEYVYEENKEQKTIYHIDLYRLRDEQEIIQAGVEDCIYSGHICFVEWPQKAPGLFDKNTVQVHIEFATEKERRINIELPSYSMKEQS